jgi:small neutral amino acid transporter SnatA (MarC family)
LAAAGLGVAVVVAFAVVAPPERCPDVAESDLRDAADETVGWFVRNQNEDGTWLYEYDATTDEAIPDYNVVRHAGVTMGLYQAAAAGLPGALASADRGTDWALDRLIEREGWAAVTHRGRTPVGATALLVAGLVDRREATGDDRYDETMGALGRFLASQVEPSGAVLSDYSATAREPVAGSYSKYYTGEAYWALARLHHVFPDDGWDEVADRVGAYLTADRDEVEGYWPPIPDHWAAYGLAETVAFPERDGSLTAAEAAYARRQAGLFGSQVRWISQRAGPWGAAVRGPFVPRGGGYGVIGEALTGLWLAAGADARLEPIRPDVAERARCVAGLAVDAQSDAAEAAGFAEPDRVRGAWFRDGTTRMDDQQHALAALLRTIPIVEAQTDGSDGSAGEDESTVSPWLWAVLLVAALNPFRAVFGVPRTGRSRRDVTAAAALGALAGVGTAAAALVIGGWALDALDVSAAAFALAAGGLGALVGAIDVIRRPPSPEPALDGWRAALVPIAVPLVARPVVLVAAVAAGADVGWWPPLAALALGGAALVGLAASAPTRGPGGRVLLWASRLAAAVLVTAAVVVTVEGVLAV